MKLNNMNKKIIKIDIDGVLRDMLSEMCYIYNRAYNTDIQPNDVKEYDVDKTFTKCKEIDNISAKYLFFDEYAYELCSYPKAIHKARESMDLLHKLGYYIIIVSYQKGYSNKRDTLSWLDKHDIYYNSICFTDRKDLVHGNIIVDDNPEFLDMCDDNEEKILIDAPYNKNIDKYQRFNSLYEYACYLETQERIKSIDNLK